MTLNTRVLADPASSREGAAYLHRLAEANHDAATAAHKARSMSDGGWSGEAADAFRRYIDQNAKDTDELVRAIREIRDALNKFADAIQTVESRMTQARQEARDGQLTVTGLIIHPPKSDPTDGVSKGMGDTSLPGLNPAADRTKDQWASWHAAEGLVDWARSYEATAHKELNKALTDANGLVGSVMKGSFWVGNAAAFAGGLHGMAQKLQDEANQRLEWAKKFERLAADSSLPAATRQAHMTKMMTSIGITEEHAASNSRALANIGNTKIGALVFNPLTKTVGDGFKPGTLRTVGKAASWSGVLVTAYVTGKQIIFGGKPVWKTIQTNFTGYGVGAAAGYGAGLAAGALGATAAPVTITAIGVGSAATWAYGYFQENDLGDLGHDIGELLDGPG